MKLVAILLLLLCCFPHLPMAQQSAISLDSLLKAAVSHHPFTKKLPANTELNELRSRSIMSAWLPDVNLNAQAGYQSLVPEFPLSIPGTSPPDIPKDRYQISLDVNQTLYDGGTIAEKLRMQHIDSQLQEQRIVIDRYGVYQQVADSWYQIQLIDRQRETLVLIHDDIEARHKITRSRFDEGLAMRADVDRIMAEQIRIDQQDDGLQVDRERYINRLKELTGLLLSASTTFEMQSASMPDTIVRNMNRPEVVLFELSRSKMEQIGELNRAMRRPKIGGYAQAAYAKPGLDIFGDTFVPFWQAGIRASWSLFDKGESERDRALIHLEKRQLDEDERLFERSQQLLIDQYLAEIRKNEIQKESDEAIVALRERIMKVTEVQYDGGIINATEYLASVRDVESARLQLDIRETRIQMAYTMIRILIGDL